MSELWELSAVEMATGVAQKVFSSRELLQAHLARVEQVNGELNAVVRLISEAEQWANDADAAVKRGDELGPLHGVPFTVKENIDVAGYPTTLGVKALENAIAPQDAPTVERMRRAGAVPFGRTNTPDFAMRVHTRSSLYGLTRNPFSPDHTAGGSSGGEASAIASGMSPCGLGNDIGGSLRNPAFCCAITSLKPTQHRIPTASSISKVSPNLAGQLMSVTGPMARRIGDLRVMLDLLAGTDRRDPFAVPYSPVSRERWTGNVAVLAEPPGGTTDPSVADSVRAAGRALAGAGYTVSEVSPPDVEEAHALWAEFLLGDLLFSLEDFRGVMSDEGIQIIKGGIDRLPTPTAESIFKLHRRRHALQKKWAEFFVDYPIILGPTWTQPPFVNDLDSRDDHGRAEVASLTRFVAPMNLLGLPVVCVPVGVHNGLPQGVQVIGNRFDEGRCLSTAADLEGAFGVFTPVSPWGQPVG